MKIKLDDKMWRLYGHCFDCQIKIETKLRATGKYEEWEKKRIRENKKSYVEDMLQGLDSWENESMPEIHNSVGLEKVELQKEQWNSNKEHMKKLAEDARKYLYSLLEEVESEEDGSITGK
jgi:hemerythrin-like domain-containing protein